MASGFSTNTNLGALPIVGLILILAVFACISGMLLARGITEPLKKVASFIEDVIGKEGEEIIAPNEIRALLSLSEKGLASKQREKA
jgi:hypothetical protein